MVNKTDSQNEDAHIVAYGLNAAGLANAEKNFKDTATADDYKRISDMAKQYKLPAGFALYEAIKRLRRAKAISSSYPYTKAERAGALERVSYACNLLTSALNLVANTPEDSVAFTEAFKKIAIEKNTSLPLDLVPYSAQTVLLRSLHVCNEAAVTVRDQIPRKGRREIQPLFSKSIADLFFVAQPAGMKLGRGNVFARFCNDAFEFAEMPKQAEGALKYFIGKEWPETQEMMRAMDSLKANEGKATRKTGRNPAKK